MDCLDLTLDLNVESTSNAVHLSTPKSAHMNTRANNRRAWTEINPLAEKKTPTPSSHATAMREWPPMPTSQTTDNRRARTATRQMSLPPNEVARRRTSVRESTPSGAFAMPTPPSRPRNKTIRRFSPSPLQRTTMTFKKLKPATPVHVTTKIKFSELGDILRKKASDGNPVDFSLPEGYTKKRSVAKKQTVKKEQSDDDDDDVPEEKPIVRMSDIGAAPFLKSSPLFDVIKKKLTPETKPKQRKSIGGTLKIAVPVIPSDDPTSKSASLSSSTPRPPSKRQKTSKNTPMTYGNVAVKEEPVIPDELQTPKPSRRSTVAKAKNEDVKVKVEKEDEHPAAVAAPTEKRKTTRRSSVRNISHSTDSESLAAPTEPADDTILLEDAQTPMGRSSESPAATTKTLQDIGSFRRSGRALVMTERMRDRDYPIAKAKSVTPGNAPSTTPTTPTVASNPNSALAIKQRFQKDGRENSPSSANSAPQKRSRKSQNPKKIVDGTPPTSDAQNEGPATKVDAAQEPEKTEVVKTKTAVAEDELKLDVNEPSTPVVETPKIVKKTRSSQKKSIAQEKPTVKKVVEEVKPVEKVEEVEVPQENVPIVTPKPKAPLVVVAPKRSSGRVSKPNRKFDEEFVTDPPAHSSGSRVGLNQSTNTTKDEPPLHTTNEHLVTIGTSSKKDSSGPAIKLKLKYTFHPTPVSPEKIPVAKEEVQEEEELVEDTRDVLPLPTAEPKKKKPKEEVVHRSILPGYVPSVKPVLGHCQRPDGSWENLGVTVGSVMDKILYEVCQDGITRHSKILSTRERRKRAIDHIKFKYNAKKAEYEAMGLKYVQAAHKTKTPFQSIILDESRKRRRETTATKNDDFLYPALKKAKIEAERFASLSSTSRIGRNSSPAHFDEENLLGRILKSESRESKLHRKSVDYLSRQFTRDIDEAIREAQIDYDAGRRKSPDSSDDEHQQQWDASEPKKKKKEKKKETMALGDYMQQRGIRDEAGIRIVNQPGTVTTNEMFYREILADFPMQTAYDDDEEGLLSVDDADAFRECDIDDVLRASSLTAVHRDACDVAERIALLIPRPGNIDGTNYTVGDMYQKTNEQPELHRAVFDSTLNVVTEQYVVECTPASNSDGDPVKDDILLYNKTLYNATQLKNAFTMFNAERQDSVYWVHKFFLECLPTHFLSSYLILLKYAKPMTSSYIGLITKSTIEDAEPWPGITKTVTDYVSVKPVDPEVESLNTTVGNRSLPNVVFLLVSPTMSVGEFVFKARYHETIFKWLKQVGCSHSEIIRLREDDDESASIADISELLVNIVCEKVREKAKRYPDVRIVLVGWGFTTYVIHRAVQLVHCVSAIIDFAFPVLNDVGRRGTADDDILLTYCPSLMFVGAEGDRFDPYAMKDMRSAMISQTGLVVVGHANDNLLVSRHTLSKLRITQKIVFRIILEQVFEFLKLGETYKERTQLCPIDLNNIVSVDTALFRGEKPTMLNMPTISGSSGSIASRRATISGDEPKKRKKEPSKSIASPKVTGAMMPLSAPLPSPSAFQLGASASKTDSARNQFELLMKKVSIPDETQRRVEKKPQVEKGDLRDRVPHSPQVFHQPPVYNQQPASNASGSNVPLDPASISLI